MDEVRLLQIEPTTRCNFTCGFCVGRHMRQVDLDAATSAQAFSLFEHLDAVELQGEGEPLLSHEFFQMADAAASRGAKLSLITNGSLMNQARVEQILERPFERVGFSLESPKEMTFAQIRGGSLRKVVEGIKRLKEARDISRRRFPVIGLNVTVLKSTIAQLDDIVALYRDLRLDGGISFQGLQAMPGYAAHYSEEITAEALADDDRRKLGQFLSQFFSNPAIDRSGAGIGFYPRLFASLQHRPSTCPWLSKAAYVSAQGEIMPCCHIKDSKWSFGNVARTDRGEFTRRRTAMADSLAKGTIPPPCAGCWVLPFLDRRQAMGP